jgi:hypothetical protein
MRFRTALAQMRGDHRPEVVHPAAHGLVRDRDPALREQILDVTKAECEPEIEPNRLMYDLGRESITGVAALSRELNSCRTKIGVRTHVQAAVAARHVRKASSRKTRSVRRDVRWRWTLKVFWTAA